MKLSFRWYGKDDKVTLEQIRQIPGMQAIVTAVYDVPVGEVWSRESIAELKALTEKAGLAFEVIESVPVHEDIKLGLPTRDRYIENYCENIRRLAEVGVRCICYNFMPVFDWTRTQLDHLLPDGSTSLVYYQEQVDQVDPLKSDSDLTPAGLGRQLHPGGDCGTWWPSTRPSPRRTCGPTSSISWRKSSRWQRPAM